MDIPRRLSISKLSPHYNKQAILAIDAVFCNGVHVPNCVYYDMDKRECRGKINGVWTPMLVGEITVTLNEGKFARSSTAKARI
jgi:hypothetical protein